MNFLDHLMHFLGYIDWYQYSLDGSINKKQKKVKLINVNSMKSSSSIWVSNTEALWFSFSLSIINWASCPSNSEKALFIDISLHSQSTTYLHSLLVSYLNMTVSNHELVC